MYMVHMINLMLLSFASMITYAGQHLLMILATGPAAVLFFPKNKIP